MCFHPKQQSRFSFPWSWKVIPLSSPVAYFWLKKCCLLLFLFQMKSGKISYLFFGRSSGGVVCQPRECVSERKYGSAPNWVTTPTMPLTHFCCSALPASILHPLSLCSLFLFLLFVSLKPLSSLIYSHTHICLSFIPLSLSACIDTLAQTHDKRHNLIHENVAALSQGLTTGLWD